MSSDSIIENALRIIEARGKNALEDAYNEMLQIKLDDDILSKPLKYYAEFIFPRVLPIFPALISLSCELVGGKPETTRSLGAAMLLITASGDVHDDIIDRSTHKFRRRTVFGKYGNDYTLLVGDALLVQGMLLFQDRCESLSQSKRKLISKLLSQSFFEIATAEALESKLWKIFQPTKKEYFKIIRLKGSVAELQCRIGGILGNACEKELDALTNYGRAVGILSTIKDEFLDTLNFSELRHRFRNELPPYPIFCALQNESLKKQIKPILEKSPLSREDLELITNLAMKSKEVQNIKMDLKLLEDNELRNNFLLNNSKIGKEAVILLQSLTLGL